MVAKRRGLGPGKVVGYEEIAEESFGKLGRLLVSTIIYIELFGTCALLFILEVGRKWVAAGGQARRDDFWQRVLGGGVRVMQWTTERPLRHCMLYAVCALTAS